MWPDSSQTQELLLRAGTGDVEAVNGLLERHRTALRRVVDLRMDRALQRRVDASDIVQEVMVEANRRLQDYLQSPKLPFHLWLRQMARDRLIDAHRRHRVAERRSLDREQHLEAPAFGDQSAVDLAAQLYDRELTPATAATRRELERRFQAAVEQLDDIDREVILMRHFEQLANSEVAQALGLSEPAAGMRLFTCCPPPADLARRDRFRSNCRGIGHSAMNSPADSIEAASDRDEQLATLLAQLTDELRADAFPDIDRVVKEHPQLARDLRELWTAVLVTEGIAAGRERVMAPGSRSSAGRTPVGGDLTAADRTASLVATAPVRPTTPPVEVRPHFDGSGGRLPREFGDYELLTELGRGGMGVVYQARQISLNRIVALKMVLGGALASPANLARFQGEAQSVALLDHPDIVPVYEVGQHAGQPYFAMQYISGSTLSQYLADGPISGRRAAELLLPVCRAIHYAHQRGILHRDLKPSNILLDREGRPHVTDFGLAKQVEGDAQLTMSGAIVGTPCHMAPEQAAGSRGRLGAASDVYSLGTILYQMLTGRPPFQAASPVDTVLLVLEQDPLPPRLLNARADRELEMIALEVSAKTARAALCHRRRAGRRSGRVSGGRADRRS